MQMNKRNSFIRKKGVRSHLETRLRDSGYANPGCDVFSSRVPTTQHKQFKSNTISYTLCIAFITLKITSITLDSKVAD